MKKNQIINLAKLLTIYLFSCYQLVAQSVETIQYEADNSVFPNPERGWFIFKELKPTHFSNENNWASNELLSGYFNQGYRIIKHIVRIPTYSENIPTSFLNNLQAEADVVRSQGMKIFYRFNYNWNHDFSNRDASLSVNLAHLEQLRPFFEKNKDVLCWMEMGFIGNWGEMHTSTSGHIVPRSVGLTESGKQILRKTLEVFPQDRVIGVRYPQVVFRDPQSYGALGYSEPLNEATAYNGSEQARLATWYANFGAGEKLWYQDQEYVAKWGPSSRFLPQWAHCDHFQDLTMDSFEWMKDATTFHYVSLSNPKDENHTFDIYERWLQDGVYNDYEKYLGYRYKMISATLDTQIATGEKFNIALRINNEGWARPVNTRNLEIILRNTTNEENTAVPVKLPEDFRLFLPGSGEEKTIDLSIFIPSSLPIGSYEVLLNLPDAEASLYNRPEYSIRLANKNSWESDTGYNKLNHTISVTQGSITTASLHDKVITLLSYNNQYVCSENGTQPMNANREQALGWEQFTIIDEDNDGILALRANNGNYVSVKDNGNTLLSNSSNIGIAEQFTWTDLGDNKVAFKAINNNYISSENGLKPMTCTRAAIGIWETFNYTFVENNKSSIATKKQTFNLFPNPATSVFTVNNPNMTFTAIQVIDVQGKIVLEQKLTTPQQTINIQNLTKGLYLVKSLGNGETGIHKLLKN